VVSQERARQDDPADEQAGRRDAHRDGTGEHPAQHGGGIVPVARRRRRAVPRDAVAH
jgi:hypothetical protein